MDLFESKNTKKNLYSENNVQRPKERVVWGRDSWQEAVRGFQAKNGGEGDGVGHEVLWLGRCFGNRYLQPQWGPWEDVERKAVWGSERGLLHHAGCAGAGVTQQRERTFTRGSVGRGERESQG